MPTLKERAIEIHTHLKMTGCATGTGAKCLGCDWIAHNLRTVAEETREAAAKVCDLTEPPDGWEYEIEVGALNYISKAILTMPLPGEKERDATH